MYNTIISTGESAQEVAATLIFTESELESATTAAATFNESPRVLAFGLKAAEKLASCRGEQN